jgi:phosphate ABC transporter phosphate-binding protein
MTRRLVAFSALVVLVVGMVVAVRPPRAGAQQSPRVIGAGSTWSQNAVDQWRADVARFGLQIDYQGVGSSAGRRFFIIGQADFAVSEIPFTPEERPSRAFTYMPIVAGGTSLMYNLVVGGTRFDGLRLSPETIAKIFTCRITRWNDPAIKADNGGADFGDQPIRPIVRSDGSGTTAQFTAYLKAMVPSIYTGPVTSDFPAQSYPCTTAAALSEGVANYVAGASTGIGAITYVETSYAIQRGFPVAAVRNVSGNYVLPTSNNVATALTAATLNPDRTQNLGGVYVNPDPNAYPISSYSYAIMPTAGFDPAKGNTLGRFIIYFICDGQAKAERLGFSPLPPNLQAAAFDALREIPGAPPPLSIEECRRTGTATAAAQDPSGTPTGGAGRGDTAAAAGPGAVAGVNPAAVDPLAAGGLVDDLASTGGLAAAGQSARVELLGSTTSPWPLVLAGAGLLLLVLVPPLAVGLAGSRPRGQRRPPSAPTPVGADEPTEEVPAVPAGVIAGDPGEEMMTGAGDGAGDGAGAPPHVHATAGDP